MINAEWHSTIYSVAAILYLLIAGIAYLRRSHRPSAAGVMILYALVSCVWVTAQTWWVYVHIYPYIGSLIERLPLYGISALAIVFWFLTQAFLHTRVSPRFWYLMSFIWLTSIITLEILLWRGLILSEPFHQIIMPMIFGASWLIFNGATFLLTMRHLQPRSASRYQTAAIYWFFVVVLTLAADIFFTTQQPLVAHMLRLAGTLFAVIIITQSHLLSIGHVVRQSLSYIIYLFSALIFYTIGLALILLSLQRMTGLSLIVTGFILAIIITLIFNPILSRLRKEISLWITGYQQDPTTILRDYSQTITNILDLKLLATVAVGTASEFLDVNRGSLFVVEYEKENSEHNSYQLRGVKGMGGDNPKPIKLRENCGLAVAFRDNQMPITQTEIDFQSRFKDMTPEEQEWLSGLNAEVYVPIFAKNEWIGLLTLGPKASGVTYSEHDLYLLSTMSDQTAVALENTRLVEGLVRLNTDFRRAYAALDQANRNLERLDRTKSDFISIASHELRTPLTLIRGSTQMLLDEPPLNEDQYYNQLLNKIDKGTERLHEIVDSLLDVAQIDTRALVLETQSVLLQKVIDQVYHDLKPASIERKQSIEINGLDNLPAISADETALQKIFYHLLINAIKYTPDGGKITITGRVLDADGDDIPTRSIKITIHDTGIGIDPGYQELIFTKFYQTGELALHSTGKTKFKGGGPGLGLAIVRGIVEAHHGKVWVESDGYDEERCPGSTFHVILPVRQENLPISLPKKHTF